MVGLDAAGKTTILYKLKLGEGESSVFVAVRSGVPIRLVHYSPPLFLFFHSRYDDPHHWFQRRDGGVQEHFVHSVGCGWSGQDPTVVASLLPKHARIDFRGGFQ